MPIYNGGGSLTPIATSTVLGNVSGTTAIPTAVNSASLTPLVNIMGASGASHAAGLAPDPGATAGTTHYLREDGTWQVPSGSGGSGTVTSVATDSSLTGGPITTSGTLGIASSAAKTLLGNLTASAAQPVANTLTATANALAPSYQTLIKVIPATGLDLSSNYNAVNLYLQNVSASGAQIVAESVAYQSVIDISRIDGTAASPVALAAGEKIGVINWAGYNGTADAVGATLTVSTNNAWSGTNNDTTFALNIVAPNSKTKQTLVASDSGGNLVLGGNSLHVTYSNGVNCLGSTAAISGSPPSLFAYGTDTNVSLKLGTQGTGIVYANSYPLAPFGASGSSHSVGLVPDPGATAGTTHYLREDGTWQVPSGGGGGGSPTVVSSQTTTVTTYSGATAYWVPGSTAPVYNASMVIASVSASASSATQQILFNLSVSGAAQYEGEPATFVLFIDGTTVLFSYAPDYSGASGTALGTYHASYIYTPGNTSSHTYALCVYPGSSTHSYYINANGSGTGFSGGQFASGIYAMLVNS